MTKFHCPYVDDAAVEYVYGSMDSEQATHFRAHLPVCPACQQEVEVLKGFSNFCRQRREAPFAEIPWRKSFAIIAPPRSWLRRFPVWVPAAAVVLLLVAIGILVFSGYHEQVNDPNHQARIATAPPVEPGILGSPKHVPEMDSPVTLDVKLSGNILVGATKPKYQADAANRSPKDSRKMIAWSSQQTLEALPGASAEIELADASQVSLAQGARINLLAAGSNGDTLRLLQGSMACKITPRSSNRPFTVEAGPAQVVVKGTKFAVRLVSQDEVVVELSEGVVVVGYLQNGGKIDLKAGQEAILKRDLPIEIRDLDPKRSGLMASFEEKSSTKMASSRAGKGHPTPVPAVSQPLPQMESPHPAVEVDSPSGKDKGKGVTEDSHQDFLQDDWVFQMLRSDIDRGKYQDVLVRLDGYLADPESPNRSEAQFLKAMCQDKAGMPSQAIEAYRRYLELWPQGDRADKAKDALQRLEVNGN